MNNKKFVPALFWLLVIPIITTLVLSLTSMTGPGNDWNIYEDDRWFFPWSILLNGIIRFL